MPDTREPTDRFADPPQGPRLAPADLAALVLGVVWVGAVIGYAINNSDGMGALGWVLTLLALIVPPMLIWAAATTLRSVGLLRAEAAELRATVEAMRSTQGPAAQTGGGYPVAAARPNQIASARPQTAAPAPRQAATPDRRVPTSAPTPPDDQPGLALGTPPDEKPPVLAQDFIRALQFPEDPDDTEGFRSLRAALGDREVAKLIRAAQDVLTLLSQESIYMDDLVPDRARPEVWRRFAAGERGRGVAPIGGVRDHDALALTGARMREDPVFRDAGHHFLRTFDRSFQTFEKTASDADISDLADTRTARAFMLFGRVMGVFD